MNYKMNFRNHGLSLIELIISIGILSIVSIGFLSGIQNVTIQSERPLNRWRAQLTAESIIDMLSSLSNTELSALASQNVSTGSFYTKATQPWLVQWEFGGFLLNPKFQIILNRTSPAPTLIRLPLAAAIVLPPVGEFSTYNKEITVQIDLRRTSNLQTEVFQWKKEIAHE